MFEGGTSFGYMNGMCSLLDSSKMFQILKV